MLYVIESLQSNMSILVEQWNIVNNSCKLDQLTKVKHLAKLEQWISETDKNIDNAVKAA